MLNHFTEKNLRGPCVDVAGTRYPTERNGAFIHPLAGTSLRPLFTGAGLAISVT